MENIIMVETILNLFTIENGIIKILLVHREEEPYKTYWELPSLILNNSENLDECMNSLVTNIIMGKKIYVEQSSVFSNVERKVDKRVIGVSYLGLVDQMSLEFSELTTSKEYSWFDVTALPKLAFDCKEIIDSSLEKLNSKLKNIKYLKLFFPSDFTIPEMQHIYEFLFNQKIDRRNFRKKFINSNILRETGDFIKGSTGRPAKLYKFNEEVIDKNIF